MKLKVSLKEYKYGDDENKKSIVTRPNVMSK